MELSFDLFVWFFLVGVGKKCWDLRTIQTKSMVKRETPTELKATQIP